MNNLKLISSNFTNPNIFSFSSEMKGTWFREITHLRSSMLLGISLVVSFLAITIFYTIRFSLGSKKEGIEIDLKKREEIQALFNSPSKIDDNTFSSPLKPLETISHEQDFLQAPKPLENITHLKDFIQKAKPKSFQLSELKKNAVIAELNKMDENLPVIGELAQKIIEVEKGRHFVSINDMKYIITKKIKNDITAIKIYTFTGKILGNGFEGVVKQYRRVGDLSLFACKVLKDKTDQRNDLTVQEDLRKNNIEKNLPGLIKKPKQVVGDQEIGLLMPSFDGDISKMPLEMMQEMCQPQVFMRTLFDLYKGLQTLHRNEYAHCDIKHENIFYKKNIKGEFEIVIGDLGKILNLERYTSRYQKKLDNYVWTPKVHSEADRDRVLSERDRIIKYYLFQELDIVGIAKSHLLMLVSAKTGVYHPMETELTKDLLKDVFSNFPSGFQEFINEIVFDRKYKCIDNVVNQLSKIKG